MNFIQKKLLGYLPAEIDRIDRFQQVDGRKIIELQKQLTDLQERFDEMERNLIHSYQIAKGLMDYLQVDYYWDKEPDMGYRKPEPKLVDVLKIKKNK